MARQSWGCRTQHRPVHTPGLPCVPKAAPPAAQPWCWPQAGNTSNKPRPRPQGPHVQRREETKNVKAADQRATCLDEEVLGAERKATSQFGALKRALRWWGNTEPSANAFHVPGTVCKPFQVLQGTLDSVGHTYATELAVAPLNPANFSSAEAAIPA